MSGNEALRRQKVREAEQAQSYAQSLLHSVMASAPPVHARMQPPPQPQYTLYSGNPTTTTRSAPSMSWAEVAGVAPAPAVAMQLQQHHQHHQQHQQHQQQPQYRGPAYTAPPPMQASSSASAYHKAAYTPPPPMQASYEPVYGRLAAPSSSVASSSSPSSTYGPSSGGTMYAHSAATVPAPSSGSKRGRSVYESGQGGSAVPETAYGAGPYGPSSAKGAGPSNKKSKRDKAAEKAAAKEAQKQEKARLKAQKKGQGGTTMNYGFQTASATAKPSLYVDHFEASAHDLSLRSDRAARFQKEQQEMKGKVTLHATPHAHGTTSSDKSIQKQSLTRKDGRPLSEHELQKLRVVGTCRELEKPFLRLTSAPDPASVRPPKVLEAALITLKKKWRVARKSEDTDARAEMVAYMRSQLKAVRQDLVVQHIQTELTVAAYETHARVALQSKDFSEFHQCEAQLRALYAKGLRGHTDEFWAYRILFLLCRQSREETGMADMTRLLNDLPEESEGSSAWPATKHALAVRIAVQDHNYHRFLHFKDGLVTSTPNQGRCILNTMLEDWRFSALERMVKAYCPAPVSRPFVLAQLGYDPQHADGRRRGGRYVQLVYLFLANAPLSLCSP